MSSKLTRDDVARIAGLARLELTSAELDLFSGQLATILDYAAAVQQVDTSGVEVVERGTGIEGLRDDEPAASLRREDAVGQGPNAATDTGFFRVPKVL
jgi:aspartyl-tRNA(Asn)/glutamyl-tRNA(Gln) amidotransferase subunit C